MPSVRPFSALPSRLYWGRADTVCQRPALRLAAYCGRWRRAAMSSAQVSSAGAVGSPTPSAIAIPLAVAAATSTWPLSLPVCEISLQLRQLVEQGLAEAGALADQHQRLEIGQAQRQLANAARAGGEDLDLVAFQQPEALEVADLVLIVVKNGYFHGDNVPKKGQAAKTGLKPHAGVESRVS